MPIATPEKYAEMLDAAKQQRVRVPGHQRLVLADPQRRARRLRGGRQRRHHPGVDRRGGLPLRARRSRTWSAARRPSRRTPTRWRRTTPSTSRCTPTTAPRTSSTGSCRPLLEISLERVRGGQDPLFQSHMWDGSAVPLEENLEIAAGAAQEGGRGADRARGRDRCRRRRGGRRRGRRRRAALQHHRGRAGHGRGARHGRERPLPDRADLRQRARRLQARQRQAAPGDPAEGAAGGHREARPPRRLQALRPRLPRRLRLDRGGDRRGRRLRRDQDERRHRHAVRLHPPDRRPTCSPTTTAS